MGHSFWTEGVVTCLSNKKKNPFVAENFSWVTLFIYFFILFITYSLSWYVTEITLKGQLRGLHWRQSTHFMFQSTSNCFQWSKDVRLQTDLTSSHHPKVQNRKLDSLILQLSISLSFLFIYLLKSLSWFYWLNIFELRERSRGRREM
jgi:hypothetical protein